METQSVSMPQQFTSFIDGKLEKNGDGGRPHFIAQLAKTGKDPKETVLTILELHWLKNRTLGSLARKYNTGYHTLYRLTQGLEPCRDDLVAYLQSEPRRKVFYHRKGDSSDYETVQAYIRRARRDGLRRYPRYIKVAERVWRGLNYKDPANWTVDEVLAFLKDKPPGMQSNFVDVIRQVAPQFADVKSPHYLKTGRFREKINRRKKDIFANEVKMIHEALDYKSKADPTFWSFVKLIFDLHIALGAREGSVDTKSGICGLSFDRFHRKWSRVDLYESKVRGGLWSLNCPVGLLFPHLPEQIKQLWTERGKPTTEKLILGGYKELTDIYKAIREACGEYWQGKTEPDLLREFTTLRPHDSDKIHCNLLWEAEVPLEVVAGQDLGQGKALGLMGRVWLSVDTIKKYYLSLTQRSPRFKKIEDKVQEYASQFNGEIDGNQPLDRSPAVSRTPGSGR